MSARPRWISLIAPLGLLAAPLLAACGGSGSHHQTTVDLKRRRLARRRDQVTWGATFTGSLGQGSSVAELATERARGRASRVSRSAVT